MVGKREDILCPALKKNWGQGERVIMRPREWRGAGGGSSWKGSSGNTAVLEFTRTSQIDR